MHKFYLNSVEAEQFVRDYLTEKTNEPTDEDLLNEEVREQMDEIASLLEAVDSDGARNEKARLLIERLIPTTIDVKLWRDIALGRNVRLPASDQYGPISERLIPTDPKVASPARGNAYGKVHSKGNQAPSEFMKRQGKEMEAATRRVLKLEAELEAARQDRENIQHGLKAYAITCLLTAMRQSTASIFAMGPAWTVLSAIRAHSGEGVSKGQSELETKRILTILHALREYPPFHRDLKTAILSACHKHEATARERGKYGHEFDGPVDYEDMLDDLKWPYVEDHTYSWYTDPTPPCPKCGYHEDNDED